MSNVQIRLLEFGGRVKGRSPLKRKLRKLALKERLSPECATGSSQSNVQCIM